MPCVARASTSDIFSLNHYYLTALSCMYMDWLKLVRTVKDHTRHKIRGLMVEEDTIIVRYRCKDTLHTQTHAQAVCISMYALVYSTYCMCE